MATDRELSVDIFHKELSMPASHAPLAPVGLLSAHDVSLGQAHFNGSLLRQAYLSEDIRPHFTEGLEGIFRKWRSGVDTFVWTPGAGRSEFSIQVSDCSDEESMALVFSVYSTADGKLQQKFRVVTTEEPFIEHAPTPDRRLFAPLRRPRDLLSIQDLTQFIQAQGAAL